VTPSQLRDERLREGFARLGVFLPVALGRPPRPAPRVVFMSGAPAPDMARWLFGEAGVLPAPQDFDQWIERGQGVAELARDIRALYGEREGTVPSSDFTGGNAMEEGPFENSVAMRNAKHPLMRSVERRLGRGPLWRFVGILADMQAMLEGAEPECRYDAATGIAIVDAPRGVYALRACVVNGKVDVFERRTPTDHMAAPKGPLELGLSSLQHVTRQKVAVFVALCDPCLPVSIREGTHA
ncbi:MAG: hypothetical protein KDJ29_02535, partial [Hyphomicrobiales bacterium]|nr:hypothetical protein [Hyphomicrobiales bacterium]